MPSPTGKSKYVPSTHGEAESAKPVRAINSAHIRGRAHAAAGAGRPARQRRGGRHHQARVRGEPRA
eukprot:8429014-Pyramimonas_sp.AAC.1